MTQPSLPFIHILRTWYRLYCSGYRVQPLTDSSTHALLQLVTKAPGQGSHHAVDIKKYLRNILQHTTGEQWCYFLTRIQKVSYIKFPVSLKHVDTVSKKYRKAEYVQHHLCFVNVQLSLHENVVFSVCARMDKAVYIMSIMWNSLSGLDAWYHFRFNISCGVAVMERGHR